MGLIAWIVVGLAAGVPTKRVTSGAGSGGLLVTAIPACAVIWTALSSGGPRRGERTHPRNHGMTAP